MIMFIGRHFEVDLDKRIESIDRLVVEPGFCFESQPVRAGIDAGVPAGDASVCVGTAPADLLLSLAENDLQPGCRATMGKIQYMGGDGTHDSNFWRRISVIFSCWFIAI